MSTLIQTCLESQVLKLKLPNRDDQFNHLKMKSVNANANANANDNGGKSFLQFLSNISSTTPKENIEKENVYFHPLAKSTSSRLSEKSLQLCTENLGCETGSSTFVMDTNINLSLSSSPYMNHSSSSRKEQEVVEEERSYSYSIKKVKSYSAFPPPLTTMSGEKSLQIITNREGGRLITKAIEIPSHESCFVADRSDGRLRLRVYVDENEDESGEDIVDENEMMYKEDHLEEHDDQCQNNDEVDTDTDDADDDEDADDEGEICKKIMSKGIVVGSSYDVVEVEKMGKEKFPRRFVRCKECNKGLGNNWEPLWVATS